MSKNPNSPSTGHASNPSAIPAPIQPPRSLPKQNKVWSRFTRRIQAIPLSTKLVTCIIVLLTIGTIGISDHAQAELSDVVFVDLPEVGATVAAGDPVAVVESVKAASDVYTSRGSCPTSLSHAETS